MSINILKPLVASSSGHRARGERRNRLLVIRCGYPVQSPVTKPQERRVEVANVLRDKDNFAFNLPGFMRRVYTSEFLQ
jgi:hypothetical protein